MRSMEAASSQPASQLRGDFFSESRALTVKTVKYASQIKVFNKLKFLFKRAHISKATATIHRAKADAENIPGRNKLKQRPLKAPTGKNNVLKVYSGTKVGEKHGESLKKTHFKLTSELKEINRVLGI